MKRVVVILLTAALIAGLVGCPADPVHDPEPEPDPDRPVQYALAISSSEGGEVTIPGEGSFTYDEGTVVSLVVEAEEGYGFVDWTGDVDTIFLPYNWAQELGLATTITMSGDYSIRANFEPILPTQYKLTVSSTSGGSVTTPGEGAFAYDAGTVVDLVAEPEEGYRCVSWTGDADTIADVEAASTTITMNGDYNITASFVAQYVLTIDSTEGGRVVTPGEGTVTYDDGAVVDLVAEPWEGHKFLNWTGDIETVANVTAASTTITLEGDCAVTASFVLEDIYLDKMGPGLWALWVCPQGVEATVTEWGVLVNYDSNPRDCGGGFGAGGRTEYTLKGDFDIRMNYELITWPHTNGVRVALSILIPDVPDQWPSTFVSVERVCAGPPEVWLDNREVYLVNWNHSIPAIRTTGDRSGTLRIRREGATVSCYYGTAGDWSRLYRGVWSAADVYVQVHTWSHEHLYGGKEASVLLRTAEVLQP